MPPTKGGNASNQGIRSIDSITAPKAEARALFTKQQKRRGPTPSQFDASPPHQKGATTRCRKKYLLVVAITTKRLLESATQEKAEVPPSALFDAFISYG